MLGEAGKRRAIARGQPVPASRSRAPGGTTGAGHPSRRAEIVSIPAARGLTSRRSRGVIVAVNTRETLCLAPTGKECAMNRNRWNPRMLVVTMILATASGCSASGKEETMNTVFAPTAQIADSRLVELSGIAPAARTGEYWGANDHGNKAALYRFNARGKVLQEVNIDGAKNRDWEAIARAESGMLLIADVGDNDEKRKKYTLHRIHEPAPDVETTSTAGSLIVSYPDKDSHNCEALFVLGSSAYLITKEKPDETPELFRVDGIESDSRTTAVPVGDLAVIGQVTDAAYSPRRRQLAVLTYTCLYFFAVTTEGDLSGKAVHETRLDLGQVESVCYDGDDLLIATEEGLIWKYPVEYYLGRKALTKP